MILVCSKLHLEKYEDVQINNTNMLIKQINT